MLPLEPTRLLGRDRDADEVRRLLGHTRLLTLAGTGGSGKTRLALRVARDAATTWPDRVWWVELASLDDPRRLAGRVARSLGLTEVPGRSTEHSIVDFLAAGDGLLVLDNCEHLVAACATLADWLLTSVPGLRLLTTSREPLRVLGETTWPVPPLATPDPHQVRTVADLLSSAAAELFQQRVMADRPDAVIAERDVTSVARLCCQLDGMPLAIELAAARARVLSVGQILDRIDVDPLLLADRGRTTPPRHRTLLATMEWSHDLLTPDEQRVLRRLSVFTGGFGLAAAEQVAAAGDITPDTVLDHLTGLVDKSLVVVSAERPAGEARYRLLETVRRFAAGKLDEAGETRSTQAAHVDWVAALGAAAQLGLTGQAPRPWIARLDADHDNIVAALAALARAGEIARGLRLLGQLGRYWWYTGRFAEGAAWIEGLLARPEAERHPHERAAALHALGLATVWHESAAAGVEASRSRFEAAAELYRDLGDDHGLAAVLSDLGGYWKGHGDGTEARACLEESMAVAERTGDAAVVAGAASYLGTVAAYADDRTLARYRLEQCLRVLPLEGGSDEATRSEFFLACLDCDDGDTPSARARLTRLMALEEVQSLPYTAGFALDGVARLAGAEGQPAKAMRLAGAAAARHQALGTSAGPAYDAFVHRGLSWARAVLGPERADRAEAQGRQLTMADAVAEGLRPAQPALAARPDLAGLSEREAEVLRCAADGLSDRDIADRLRLSRRTVGNHLGSVYRKFGVASRTAAIRAGRDRGLLD